MGAWTDETMTRMPNAPRTPNRAIRISDDDWADLGKAAQAVGSDRTKVVVQLIRWYLRRPGVKMPTRPDLATWDTNGDGEP